MTAAISPDDHDEIASLRERVAALEGLGGLVGPNPPPPEYLTDEAEKALRLVLIDLRKRIGVPLSEAEHALVRLVFLSGFQAGATSGAYILYSHVAAQEGAS